MTASSPSLVLVHAQEQLKGKLSLTPLSRFDIQLYHVQRHLAGQETCKPWEPMRQGSLVHNYSITGNSTPRSSWQGRRECQSPSGGRRQALHAQRKHLAV